MSSSPQQGLEGNGPQSTRWQNFQEWLLPSHAFENSESQKSDLRYARTLIASFYAIISVVIVYTVVRLCWSGRIEVFTNMYKVDTIEAPSLAICPFNANASIERPDGAAPWVSASKVGLHGTNDLKVTARDCTFDRTCICVDMSSYHLNDVKRNVTEEILHDPTKGVAQKIHEGIEIRTNLTDPSEESILKVGIYDSTDSSLDWLYVNQGSMFVGQLELIVWTVVDVSVSGLVKTLKGDLRAMAKNRHIFRYTSQQVGNARIHGPRHETSIRYEMKTFFVEETMSSPRAFSLYTVGVLIALAALRIVIVEAFFSTMLPEWKGHTPEATAREISPTADWLRNYCFFCCFTRVKDEGENQPLLRDQVA